MAPRFAIMVAIVWPALAAAGPVCDALGRAAAYGIIASKRLTVRAGFSYAVFGVEIAGSVCTTRAVIQLADLEPRAYATQANLVALKATGAAIGFHKPTFARRGALFDENSISGDVVTGGGAVHGPPDYVEGVTDTSGSHAAVADCRQAMADAQQASDTFAAMPTTQILGDVVVPLGETRTIDATGGAVIQIDSLVLQDAPLHRAYGYPGDCYNVPAQAGLEFVSNPGDPVIVNVHELTVGNCAYITGGYGMETIINVPGRGPRVRIGVQADLSSGPNVLAPQRSLTTGGGLTDTATYLDRLWVKSAVLSGYTAINDDEVTCPD